MNHRALSCREWATTVAFLMTQTAVCNRHHSVSQRLCCWLLLSLDRLPGDELTMIHELIANMPGVRHEGVTEDAGNLQHDGMIRYSRGRITVLDRPKLERAVLSVTPQSRRSTTACSRTSPVQSFLILRSIPLLATTLKIPDRYFHATAFTQQLQETRPVTGDIPCGSCRDRHSVPFRATGVGKTRWPKTSRGNVFRATSWKARYLTQEKTGQLNCVRRRTEHPGILNASCNLTVLNTVSVTCVSRHTFHNRRSSW